MAYERLSAQDATFLHIEDEHQPQHVGSLGLFEAGPLLDSEGRFRIEELRAAVGARLDLIPRFRQKLMTVPLDQGRPVWVDDDRFDLSYHVRLTALPTPGSEEQLKALFARLQAHLLDRRRPLWELWFVEGLVGDRVAIIQKTHHCLIDGISGVDVATVLLDTTPEPAPVVVSDWVPEPPPDRRSLLRESLVERTTEPTEMIRSARALLRFPRQAADGVAKVAMAVVSGAAATPHTPWNVPISPHRRWELARVPLAQVKAIKDMATSSQLTSDGCSVNDVVLAACTGALRAFLIERGVPVEDLELKAMVPVSMRSEEETGALGNRVSMVPAVLPVSEVDARWRLRFVHDNMAELKESGLAVGADDLIRMTNYLPPTVLGVASRLLTRSLAVNTTITNIPGPQFPLYCQGARMLEAFPYVGIIDNMALTIAVVSYDGSLGFGITGDRDILPDLDRVAQFLTDAVDELERELKAVAKPSKRRSRAGTSR